MDYEEFIFNLMDAEPSVFGGAVISKNGELLYQTENWDVSQDLDKINRVIAESQKPEGEAKNPGKLSIMKISYMIVEMIPERIIGTNVSHKGHIIIANADNGSIVTFIDPSKGPRDALFNVQSSSRKL